jgi:hypothetical protein
MAARDKHGDGEAGRAQGEGDRKEKRGNGAESSIVMQSIFWHVRPGRFALCVSPAWMRWDEGLCCLPHVAVL